ncbi:hypothetical protein [Achromobacter sp. Marseille-Q0513]|uniref:hypothetical protein n=1 Tax=Achromobacter sp. Marseille-Q0513 TaxID=2829161 RepID=UPI002010D2FA|nr:hypothetical protein [Achromobacter sp. Marseille-Q0513]
MTMPRMSFLSSGRAWRGLAGAVALVVLGACASGPEKAMLVPVVSADAANTQVLSRAVTGKLSDGQAFRLEDASQWRRVGALVQGDVYRPLGAPVTLGKGARSEAYLVASSGRLIGFYLPAASMFLPLSESQVLPFSQRL